MKHIWINDDNKINSEVYFELELDKEVNKMTLSIAPFYSVFFDDNLVSFGPERTASGYSRIRTINIPKNIKKILIKVPSYGIPSYDCDWQDPFFGAELFNDDNLVYSSTDFKIFKSTLKNQTSSKYSFQRGFVERYNFRNVKKAYFDPIEITSPVLLGGIGDTCKYNIIKLDNPKLFDFTTFDEVAGCWYFNSPYMKEYLKFDIQKEFIDVVSNNDFKCFQYELNNEKTGLIKISIDVDEEQDAFICFNEYLNNGKWKVGRGNCLDVICLSLAKGHNEVISSVPYAFKYLRVLIKDANANISISLICIQNDTIERKVVSNDEKIQKIYDAGLETYTQNAVDVYTDCPGRERAGWLCDSYFASLAEFYFTGKNDIEKKFLENIILARCEEIDEGMVPMCFPSQHFDNNYIPNWGMWFVLELRKYYKNNHDDELIKLAKDKVYALVKYFLPFENEFGLLENLKKWVFVEWSISNSPEYIKSINFPTNMLYSEMLEAVDELYNDKELKEKANNIKQQINKFSWTGKYYCDNAIRENNIIVPQKYHISETCQYYALFFNLNNDKNYINRMLNNFSPLVKENPDNVGKSNAFIGCFVRFLWLNRLNEFNRIEKESKEFFYHMALSTGTLWEHDNPSSSCNHGFASSIIPIMLTKINNF